MSRGMSVPTGWNYVQSETYLWTVGSYDSHGQWQPESDYDSPEKAAARVHYLNGGSRPGIAAPVDSNFAQSQIGTNQLLVELLAEVKHLRAAFSAAQSRSSVEIKSGTNGRKSDICVKAYEGSDILDAESQAVESFGRVHAELEARLLAGWAETVKGGMKGT